MDICISHGTALRWLLANPNPLASGRGHRCDGPLPSRAPARADAPPLITALSLDASRSIDVLVASSNKRPQSKRFAGHLCTSVLPTGSLISLERIHEGLAIVSPELLFVEMACTHSVTDLIAIGYALCSGYLLAGETAGVKARGKDDAPLTSVEKLARYIARAGSMRGKNAATRALRYIANGSLSPMESGLAMSLSLPLNLGGFALGRAQMNPSVLVQVATDVRGNAVREVRRPDVIITAQKPDGDCAKAAIDYDSNAHHLDAKAHARDAIRRNDFQASLGIPYFTLTTQQATDYVAFEKFVCTVRRSLGIRNKLFARSRNDGNRLDAIRHRQFELWLRFLSSAAVVVGKTL